MTWLAHGLLLFALSACALTRTQEAGPGTSADEPTAGTGTGGEPEDDRGDGSPGSGASGGDPLQDNAPFGSAEPATPTGDSMVDPMGEDRRPPPEADGSTEAWVGVLVNTATVIHCEVAAALGSGDNPLPVVLVFDRDREGTIVRGSLLLGRGEPPPTPSHSLELGSMWGCEETLFEGFEYPLRDIIESQTELSAMLWPLEAFATWCEQQTPVAVSGEHITGYACAEPVDDDAKTDPDQPGSLLTELCLGDDWSDCRCDESACHMQLQEKRISFVQVSSDRMEGFLEGAAFPGSHGGRIVLERR